MSLGAAVSALAARRIAMAAAMAFVAGLGTIGGVWVWGTMRYNAGWADGRAALIAEQRESAARAREVLRDVETGTGDLDVDVCNIARRLQLVPVPAGCD